MADLGSGLKSIFMKGMESIGNAAANIANNTKTKVNEMSMVNRRNEILADFGNRAYGLWLKGEKFPEELDELLRELKTLDEKLNDLRTEKYANIKQKKEEAAAPVLEVKEEADASDADGAPAEEESAPSEEEENTPSPEEENTDSAGEEAPEKEVPVIRVEKEGEAPKTPAPVSSAIDDLFNKIPDTAQVHEKVDGMIDSLEDGLGRISSEIDKDLDKLTEKIKEDQ